MAKQTFTTGQVLTAAQMTSLQQTAMGGGSATAKTASYVLVAADAGTTVAINAAGATTITVNTALFAAGDTVYLQNLGAGVSTITAGTATVNTSATLALSQYEGGQLYFTSTSASIFVKGAGAAAGGGPTGYTLLNSGTIDITGNSTVTFSTLSAKRFLLFVANLSTTASNDVMIRFNGDTAANYSEMGAIYKNATPFATTNLDIEAGFSNRTGITVARTGAAANSIAASVFVDLAETTGTKNFILTSGVAGGTGGGEAKTLQGIYEASAAITSITILTGSAATFDGSSEFYILGAN